MIGKSLRKFSFRKATQGYDKSFGKITLVLIDKEFYFKCRKVLCHSQENICMKI